jgi:Tol biopolymer transport system component
MPFTGSYAELEHVLQHEMTHQFQYDTWSRGRAGGGLSTIIAINPPLWFAEGMAEYLSLGPINPETAMWLRDASLEGSLPTIEQMTLDPYKYFPYRFGHALWSYIGERWGDEAVGAILKATLGGGVEGAFRRTIGLTLDQLSDQWRDAVQKKYLPEIGARAKARAVAEELLTEKRSQGTLHLAPALSPDGSQVAYFSEKDFYFVDLYLADGKTGKVKRRILKSGVSSNYETYRFINSQANWSPDGKYLAFAAKRGARDDIVIVDVARNKEVKRIQVKLSGVTTPAWSPDGQQLVFTGYDGGLSDLFTVKRDGSGLRRLTQDKYADLHPVWSPDGKTIAFATDRGQDTDFRTLKIGNMRIALYDLDTGSIQVLDQMDRGKNVSPQWAPDGGSIAFVSDRNGVSNIYLYDLGDKSLYQLTDSLLGPPGGSSGVRVLREGQVRRLHAVQPTGTEAPALPANGPGQQRASGQHRGYPGGHDPLAPGSRGGSPAGGRRWIDIPNSPGIPLLQRSRPHRRYGSGAPPRLDRSVDGFCHV